MSAQLHSARKHSKYSASGSERWFACPGSVGLSEGLPDRESPWSKEGTRAHEVHEAVLRYAIKRGLSRTREVPAEVGRVPFDMLQHVLHSANFILEKHAGARGSEILVETRIQLDFIHPEMFGTFDGAIVDHFGTLDVFDFKYGAGHYVTPGNVLNPNLQMVFYGLGLASRYDWNFKRARLWIIQPRHKTYEKPTFVELPILELWKWVKIFSTAVKRVEENPDLYVEGQWCHWCKAKTICPLKKQQSLKKAASAFAAHPF